MKKVLHCPLLSTNSRMFNRYHYCKLSLGLFGVLLLPSHAWAGQWSFDGYKYTLSSHSDHQVWHTDYSEGPISRNVTDVNSETHYQTSDQMAGSLSLNAITSLDNDPAGVGDGGGMDHYQLPSTYIHVLVTPVFKWVPNALGDEYGEGSHPDPNDKPTKKLWYWESSDLSANRHRNFTNGGTPVDPYDGHPWSVSEFSNGLGTERETSPSYGGVVKDSATGGGVVQLDTYGHATVSGNSRLVKVKVGSTLAAAHGLNSSETTYADVFLTYTVKMASLRLETLPQAGRTPGKVADFQFNPQAPANTADIAAGGLTTDLHEHKADVAMQVLRPDGNTLTPISGVKHKTLPRLRLSRHEGKHVQGTLDQKVGVQTDENGRIWAGVYTSRDVTNDAPTTTLAYIPNIPNGPGAYFVQHWGNVEFFQGAHGTDPWDPSFFAINTDYSKAIVAQVKSTGDVPLTGHTMKFIVSHMEITKYNAMTGQSSSVIYTTNPDETLPDTEDGSPQPQLIYRKHIDASQYVEFDPATAHDTNDGRYNTMLKIKHDLHYQVSELTLGIEDQGAYHP